jgi:hypothetical protein
MRAWKAYASQASDLVTHDKAVKQAACDQSPIHRTRMGACLALTSDEIDEIGGLKRLESSVGPIEPAVEDDQVVGVGADSRAREPSGCDRIEEVVRSV